MKEKIKDKDVAIFAAMASFLGVTFMAADGIIEMIQEGVEDIVGAIIDSWVNLIETLTGTFISEIANTIEVMFDVLLLPIEGTIDIIEEFFEGLGGLFGQLFGQAAIVGDSSMIAMAAGQIGPLGAPSVAWGVLGIVLSGVGVSLITTTASFQIPILGWVIPLEGIGGGIGSIFIITGSMIGVWGFFPDMSHWILGGTFAIIFGMAGYTYMEVVRSTLGVDGITSQ